MAKVKELTDAGHTVVLQGHACPFAGSREYNIMLSENRSKQIKEYFVQHGIPADKLKVVGFGFEKPIVRYGNMEQHAVNRRVEYQVV